MAANCFSIEDANLSKNILDNGLTILVKEEHANPIATVMITVGTGLSSEGFYAGSGISHLAEHLSFEETQTRKPGEIEKEIKSYGGTTNAWTGQDTTGFYITVPKEHLSESLELIE